MLVHSSSKHRQSPLGSKTCAKCWGATVNKTDSSPQPLLTFHHSSESLF